MTNRKALVVAITANVAGYIVGRLVMRTIIRKWVK